MTLPPHGSGSVKFNVAIGPGYEAENAWQQAILYLDKKRGEQHIIFKIRVVK
jgi:hypothetical protein